MTDQAPGQEESPPEGAHQDRKEEAAPKKKPERHRCKGCSDDHKDDRQELVDHLQHLQAEFENYKKRIDREKSEFMSFASAQVLTQFLPLVDNLELALTNAKPGEKDGFYKGVELIYGQLLELLEQHGIKAINPQGQFDPYCHEALLAEERKDVSKNTIIEVLQKGYELNGKMIRPAKVKVAK
jgi:molecular chaperone GrpE